jgi:glycosyltransferase involved in cell wall biosynthesis
MNQPLPAVSVVVPTRNRPGDVAECVRTVLACTGPAFELAVVDQSDGDDTARALAVFSDPRLRLIRSPGQGASAGRNHGIANTTAPLIALTDDDCRVPPDWLEKLEAAFAADPALALLCGRVRIPPLEPGAFVAEFEAPDIPMTPDLECGLGDLGISANMSARRAALAPLGWFDEALSPGTPLMAGEDFDLVVRALGAGLKVRNVAAVELRHVGVRYGPDARRLGLGYRLAVGACFFKHTRLGNKAARRIFFGTASDLAWKVARAVVTNTRPVGFHSLRDFLRGALAASRFDIDPRTRLFLDKKTGLPVRLLRQP